jgi:universal stress protein E
VLDEDAGAEEQQSAANLLREQLLPLLAESGASLEVTAGLPFREIIRRVLREGHDLVMLAARRHSLLHHSIVGSTAIKLLRKCPCPVWVVPRRFDHRPLTVLSAAGFHGLTAQILALSASLVALTGGQWHVLHCMEYQREGAMRLQHASSDALAEYRAAARDDAWKRLHALGEPVGAEHGVEPKFWLAQGDPDEEIIKAVEQLEADVLVMGTVGREGVQGLLIGNTAEKVLRLVQCSVLAVKPARFVSPITLDD